MIDTVRLRSPFISDKLADLIEKKSFLRIGIDMKNEDIIYQLTTMQLEGTYDSRISLQIKRGIWVYNEKKQVAEIEGNEPYIILECSVNKILYGHNVYGGSNDVRQIKLILKLVELALELELPEKDEWEIERLDYAEIFDIGKDNVSPYILTLGNSYYSRRKSFKFKDETLYYNGTTTTLKFYNKGKEFIKHDKKRLKSYLELDKIDEIANIANRLLRVECEIKKKKVIYDRGYLYKVKDIDIEYYKNIYNIEVEKVIKLNSDNEYYYKINDVKKVIFTNENISKSMANNLFGTWLKLSLEGEEVTKQSMSSTTFYNHRKILRELRCNWNNNIVEKRDDNIIDFLPYSNSKYNYEYKDNRLEELFKKYNIA